LTPEARARQRALGYLEVITAAALWGSSGPFSVALMRMGMSPESLALLRPVLGAVSLTAVALLWRRSALRIGGRELLHLTLLGGAAVGVFQLTFQLSTGAVGVPTTVGLMYLSPAVVVAGSGPLLGEWPSRRTLLLVGLSIVGVWLVVRGGGALDLPGGTPLWGILCGVSYGSYTLFGRHWSPRCGPLATILFSTVGGCLVLGGAWAAGVLPVEGPPSGRAWLVLVVFSVTTMTVAALLFFDALRRIEATRAAIATTTEPVVAALLAAFLLGQTLPPVGWLGLALVVGGVAGAYGVAGRTSPPPPHV